MPHGHHAMVLCEVTSRLMCRPFGDCCALVLVDLWAGVGFSSFFASVLLLLGSVPFSDFAPDQAKDNVRCRSGFYLGSVKSFGLAYFLGCREPRFVHKGCWKCLASISASQQVRFMLEGSGNLDKHQGSFIFINDSPFFCAGF